MKLLAFILFNGFLFSITSSAVHDKKSDPASPVLEKATEVKPIKASTTVDEKGIPFNVESKPGVELPEDDCPQALAS